MSACAAQDPTNFFRIPREPPEAREIAALAPRHRAARACGAHVGREEPGPAAGATPAAGRSLASAPKLSEGACDAGRGAAAAGVKSAAGSSEIRADRAGNAVWGNDFGNRIGARGVGTTRHQRVRPSRRLMRGMLMLSSSVRRHIDPEGVARSAP